MRLASFAKVSLADIMARWCKTSQRLWTRAEFNFLVSFWILHNLSSSAADDHGRCDSYNDLTNIATLEEGFVVQRLMSLYHTG